MPPGDVRYNKNTKSITHANKSENHRGILFMYDHDRDVTETYHPGILKVHEAVFQK